MRKLLISLAIIALTAIYTNIAAEPIVDRTSISFLRSVTYQLVNENVGPDENAGFC